MKKQKLNLDNLKVKSFVTSMDKGRENTVLGGDSPTNPVGPFHCLYNEDSQEGACSDFCFTTHLNTQC